MPFGRHSCPQWCACSFRSFARSLRRKTTVDCAHKATCPDLEVSPPHMGSLGSKRSGTRRSENSLTRGVVRSGQRSHSPSSSAFTGSASETGWCWWQVILSTATCQARLRGQGHKTPPRKAERLKEEGVQKKDVFGKPFYRWLDQMND